MKHIFFAASIALLALTGCNTTASRSVSAVDSTGRVASSAVAYVNFDSLIAKYDMYIALSADFQAKATKAETDLQARARSFERDVTDFQNKIQKGLITTANAQTTQANLERRQQALAQQQQTAMATLAEEESVMINQIHYAITEYLKEFNDDLRYGMIISTSSAGPILHADPALDITDVVVEGLNERYASEKKQSEAPIEE